MSFSILSEFLLASLTVNIFAQTTSLKLRDTRFKLIGQ